MEIHFPNVYFRRHSFVLPEKLSRALRQETSILWAKLCVYKENIQPPHLAPTPVQFGGSHSSAAAPRIVLLRATEKNLPLEFACFKISSSPCPPFRGFA